MGVIKGGRKRGGRKSRITNIDEEESLGGKSERDGDRSRQSERLKKREELKE